MSLEFESYWKNLKKMPTRPPFYRTIYGLLHPYEAKGWVFSDFRKQIFMREYAEWEMFYLPVNVNGKIVLDVGAGEGETARFYLEHGAKKVICIEPENNAFNLLVFNSKNRSMEGYNKAFDLSDLNLEFDVLKMDIEGYEEILLDVPKITKPCIIEVHGLQLIEKFLKKGYKLKTRSEKFSSIDLWFGYVTSF